MILREARDDRDPAWEPWAKQAYYSVVYSTWVDRRGVYQGTITQVQRVDAVRRLVDVFGWVPSLDVEGRLWLVRHYESQGKTAEALAEYRYLVEHPRHIPGTLPDYWDQTPQVLTQLHDNLIDARFKVVSLSRPSWAMRRPSPAIARSSATSGWPITAGRASPRRCMRLRGGAELGFPPAPRS